MCRHVVLLLITLSVPGAASAQNPRVTTSQEPFRAASVSSLVSRSVVGAAVGAGLSLALLRLGAQLGPRGGEDPGMLGAAAGATVGAVLGTAIGVHGVARAHGSRSSLGVAVVSTLAGYFVLGALASAVDIDNQTVGMIAVYTIPAAVAGFVTHQVDRRAAEERRFELEVGGGPGDWRVGATVRF